MSYLKRSFFVFLVCLFMRSAFADESSITNSSESAEMMRQRTIETVNAARSYQDMMDEQMAHLKNENAGLHDKLQKFQEEFNAIAKKVETNLEKEKVATGVSPENATNAVGTLATKKTVVPQAIEKSNHAQDKPQLKNKIITANAFLTAGRLTKAEKMLVWMANLKLAIGLIAFSLLVLAWLFWTQRAGLRNVAYPDFEKNNDELEALETGILVNQKNTTPVEVIQVNQEGEYDYMGSPESMPVKLDLATMYMTMGDELSAKLILDELVAQGSAPQKASAKELLAQLNENALQIESTPKAE